MGATVMISQFYGAKDLESIRHTVNTMYTALIIISVPLTLIGILLSDPLLRLMQVPDDGTLDMARTYMIVIFIGIIGTLGFNLNAGILQGFGDSRTSLLFLLIATIINIVLDLLFTAAMGMGVLGCGSGHHHCPDCFLAVWSLVFKTSLRFSQNPASWIPISQGILYEGHEARHSLWAAANALFHRNYDYAGSC